MNINKKKLCNLTVNEFLEILKENSISIVVNNSSKSELASYSITKNVSSTSDKGNEIDDSIIFNEITQILHSLGVSPHFLGYKFIRAALCMSIKDLSIIEQITKVLYPSIAKKFDSTPSRVERAIRHAIECAWSRGNIETQEEFFGFSVDMNKGKPTNSEFLAMITDHLYIKFFNN